MPPDPYKNSKPAICPLISTIAVMAGAPPASNKIVPVTAGPQVMNFNSPCVGQDCAWFVDGACAVASIAKVIPDMSASARAFDYLVHLKPTHGSGFVIPRFLPTSLFYCYKCEKLYTLTRYANPEENPPCPTCQSGMELRQPADVTADRPGVDQAERSGTGNAVQPVERKE